MFTCCLCDKQLLSRNLLRRHVKRCHEGVDVDTVCPLIIKRTNIKQASCDICNKLFRNVYSVRRHMIKHHQEVDVNEVCPLLYRNDKLVPCPVCSRKLTCRSGLRKHMKRVHREYILDSSVALPSSELDIEDSGIICHKCAKLCKTEDLELHMKQYHGEGSTLMNVSKSNTAKVISRKLVRFAKSKTKASNSTVGQLKCSIDTCSETFSAMCNLVQHLNSEHNLDIQFEHLKFSSMLEFKDWLNEVQASVPCHFIRKAPASNRQREYYYCHRSGLQKLSDVERKRRMKVQGLCKINRTCPAHAVCLRNLDGSVEVRYIGKHFCHSNRLEQLGHVRLSEAERCQLADKLASNMPIEAILQDIRNSAPNDLSRLHVTTRKDLLNIVASYSLSKPVRLRKRKSLKNLTPTEKEFDRLIDLCKGRYTQKQCEMHQRHKSSLSMKPQIVEVVNGSQWLVAPETSDKEFHTISLILKVCTCDERCKECCACFHMFSCTCLDYAKLSIMCSHIHYICRHYRTSLDFIVANDNQVSVELQDHGGEIVSTIGEVKVVMGGAFEKGGVVTAQAEERELVTEKFNPPSNSIDVTRKKLLESLSELSKIVKTENNQGIIDFWQECLNNMKDAAGTMRASVS